MLAAILPIKSIFLPLFIFAARKKISEKDKYFFNNCIQIMSTIVIYNPR